MAHEEGDGSVSEVEFINFLVADREILFSFLSSAPSLYLSISTFLYVSLSLAPIYYAHAHVAFSASWEKPTRKDTRYGPS